jgi:mRNA-degrading endonuclease RelE of RelBE toxin-antitoxin system
MYIIKIEKDVAKFIKKLPAKLQNQIFEEFDLLKLIPTMPGS